MSAGGKGEMVRKWRTCIVSWIRHPMYVAPHRLGAKESEIDPRGSLIRNRLLGRYHDNRCALGNLGL
jgi:hypothetical protein